MLTEKEEADKELRRAIADIFLDALNIAMSAVGHSTADIVLALDDSIDTIRGYQNTLKAVCQEVRNSQPPPRPSSEHPARSGTMPSPSEGAARDDWHLSDHLDLATRATDEPKRLSTIRPPPPTIGIAPVPSIATAATDPAPPPKPKPKPKAKKAAVRAKAKQKRKR